MIKVMGILNMTPDSFSDGGRYIDFTQALKHAESMLKQGAQIIDIGGESTRPGAGEVAEQEEIDRVIPMLQALKANYDCDVSIDTSKAAVMDEAIRAGADLINDVRALREPSALEICAKSDIPICLMHMQGQPRTMQEKPEYDDVVVDVALFFEQRIKVCELAGIKRDRLTLDPGFGFGKTLEHNLQLLASFEKFLAFNLPLLVGISRKSMIGALLNDAPADQRLFGSLSAGLIAAMKGATIIRTHDVAPTIDTLRILKGVMQYD